MNGAPADSQFVLTVRCPERPGILHAITSFVVEHGCDISEHQQFDDTARGQVFLRTGFTGPPAGITVEGLRPAFTPTGDAFQMDWQLYDASRRPRVLIMVSRFDHCLTDLLYRWRSASLPAEPVLVVSNHADLRALAEDAGLRFVHLPVTTATKPAAEAELLRLVEAHQIELVVLARYMQILSNDLCKRLDGRAINIHHSFLPGFAGARPYHQAYDRGVKLVGATAHYVTPELDEGPIIEQEVVRVDHRLSPDGLVAAGRDAERVALARAVTWHCQRRVLLNGNRTVVFD
ncbi:formyltetrahydrofolate deformylase [Plantactinospora sp. WMMB334]|uniref:formyltetrahydrofolate deformylase n=1 Tax=Plantactinospora sp. WMMB334 TaxID=3404119 RepID=UPI003B934296